MLKKNLSKHSVLFGLETSIISGGRHVKIFKVLVWINLLLDVF